MADPFDTLAAEVELAQKIAASASGGAWAADIVRGDLDAWASDDNLPEALREEARRLLC